MVEIARAPADVSERYEAVIGIEVHCQLKTASKMFCGCSTAYDGAPPNSHVCPVCLGLPGALPVINRRAVEHVLATGLAIDATVPAATRWDRKNYFYPDLPKGYQISQYDLPLASLGRLTFETSEGPFTVTITRAHLEEDTAKLIHPDRGEAGARSLVDFNRSGTPLMEIVTEPEIRTAEQARRYAEELQLLLRAIGASDADMEHGQMRVEANVSLRPRGTEPFGTRIEVKNMNSFRSVERAIAYEIERQAAAIDAGEPLVQETRGWDEGRGETYRMRMFETSEGPFTVTITRAHLEEDTAKLIHPDRGEAGARSLVDFNRSGTPLMEIVTEPEIRTAEQARRYAEELQLLLRAIGASDADMEHGQMRVEANVSLRPRGTEPFGTRVEVKNMNSFRSVERAIAYEIERQAAALDAGEPLVQETRGWDEGRGETYRMRIKETSDDYRYFPEPDLPPLHLDAAWLAEVRAALPELPAARLARYVSEHGLSGYDAGVLVADPGMYLAFEAIRATTDDAVPSKVIANFVMGPHARELKSAEANAAGTAGRSDPAEIARLLEAIQAGTVSRQIGRELLDEHLASGASAAELLAGGAPSPMGDDETLLGLIDAAIADNPKAVADYRAGKPVIGWLVGRVMAASAGAADAARVKALLGQRLDRED